jgi:hypothetical protein
MEDHSDIRIIAVPYDSGHPGLRMGAGPNHLLENGLGALPQLGERKPSVTTVRHEREPTAEIATAFELQCLVSGRVRQALAEGEVPLVLSGNCNTAIGTSRVLTPRAWASSGSTPTESSTRRRLPQPVSSTGWAWPSPWDTAGSRWRGECLASPRCPKRT